MSSNTDQSPHVVELQSLRGLAAATVMVHHALRAVGGGSWTWALSEVPLNARAAVVLFFVLSGYVLGLSLMRRGLDASGVMTFYIRRAFRIYPALWVALLLGAAYFWLVQPIPSSAMAPWAHNHYNPARLGTVSLIGSVVGVDNFLLPTAWTITVEIGASLLLPAIVFVMLRWPGRTPLLLLALLPIGLFTGPALRQVPFYIGAFALGAALACLPLARSLRPVRAASLAAATVLLFSQLVLPSGYGDWLAMLAETLASAVLVAGIVAHRVGWMRARALVALGDWSYSLYLLHLPVVYIVVRLADNAGLIGTERDGAAVLVALVVATITVPLSALTFRYVELPGIAAGTALLRGLRSRSAAARGGAPDVRA